MFSFVEKKTMYKFCRALALVIFGSLVVFAQTEKLSDDASRFAPSSEEFSVASSPVAFIDRSPPVTDASRLTYDNLPRRYSAETAETYFYIFSDAPKKPEQYKIVADFMSAYKPAPTSVSAGGAAGEHYAFADADGFFHGVSIFKTERRIYVFQTVSRSERDADAERFFAGIRFDRRQARAETKTAPDAEKIEKSQAAAVENPQKIIGGGRGEGTGNRGFGSGAGNGNGSGNGGGNTSGNPAPSGQREKLKILSKPRAEYTNLARFYEISGRVRVRVTFLATGEIGAVEVLSKVPFGLTAEAVKAARAIQFAPATRDGKPFNTVAMVEYGFTIY